MNKTCETWMEKRRCLLRNFLILGLTLSDLHKSLLEGTLESSMFCRIVYVIDTFKVGRNKKRKDNGENFGRRDCIRKFSYHRKLSYHEIFCSFMSEEIPQ